MIKKRKYRCVSKENYKIVSNFHKYQTKSKEDALKLLLSFLDSPPSCTKFRNDSDIHPIIHNMVFYTYIRFVQIRKIICTY